MGQTPPRDPIPAPKPPPPPTDAQKAEMINRIERGIDPFNPFPSMETPKLDSPPTPDDRSRFDKWAMPSCRCDAEAAQDFAQLELARKRLAKAERATAAERARKWCFIFSIPVAFFVGNILALLIMRAAGFGTNTFWAVLTGCFFGTTAIGAFITWFLSEAIASRISKIAGGLWG